MQVTGLSVDVTLSTYMPPRNFECHREVLRDAGLAYTDFSLKYHRVVVNMCEMGFAPDNVTRNFVETKRARAQTRTVRDC